jgi:transposase-like protein
MDTSRKKVSPEIKSQILSELEVPGCIVSQLGKKYNVSSTTIYTWQRQAQQIRPYDSDEVDKVKGFIELSVNDARNSRLEKASLVFNDFSLVIEGSVKSSSLFAIVKIMEEQ